MLIHELVIRVDAIRHCIFWMEGMPFDARLGEIDINDVHYDFSSFGLKEWFTEYETNYDWKTGQEKPDFNLFAWNEKGVLISKEIAKTLPLNIELYYQSPKNIDGNYTGECIKIK